MNFFPLLLFIMPAMVTPPFEHAPEADGILGIWFTRDGKSRVEVYKCGEYYCGKIVELTAVAFQEEEIGDVPEGAELDRNNPDPELRQRPLLGLEFMKRFSFKGNRWSGGTIYDPEKGKTYKGKLTMKPDGSLRVRGYLANPSLGRTSTWTRTMPEAEVSQPKPNPK